MKKDEVIDLASRRGMSVYEQYTGRKIYYKIKIPIFSENKILPTGSRDELVENVKEVKKAIDKVWEDDQYRTKVSEWFKNY